MDVLLSTLQAALDASPPNFGLVVAYSGGLDSTCLLHASRALDTGRRLRAVHVNHGLQKEADAWQSHCQEQCAALAVEFIAERVDLCTDASEDAARQARYEVFERLLEPGETLLLAHHLDDQLETLLLRLMRGSGSAGLAGMPARRALGEGTLCRPWLTLERRELVRYAGEQQLDWIEDSSNASRDFDRNFCRHEILPRLEQRWPAYRQSWHKSQTLLAESDSLLADLARMDLLALTSAAGEGINLQQLAELSSERQRNVLRYWLQGLGIAQPGWQLLHQLVAETLVARDDNNAVLDVGELRLQRFQSQLFALRHETFTGTVEQLWRVPEQNVLALPGNGRLVAMAAIGSGLHPEYSQQLRVRYRQGGEAIQLPGRPAKSLKKLFQEMQVPPWLRQRMPLLYKDDDLVCVPGIGVAAACAVSAGEQGWQIDWQQPDLLLGASS